MALITAALLYTPLNAVAADALRALAHDTLVDGQLQAAREINEIAEGASGVESADDIWIDYAEADGLTLHVYYETRYDSHEFTALFDSRVHTLLAQDFCSDAPVRWALWLGAVHVYHYTATDNKTEAEYRVSHSDCQA